MTWHLDQTTPPSHISTPAQSISRSIPPQGDAHRHTCTRSKPESQTDHDHHANRCSQHAVVENTNHCMQSKAHTLPLDSSTAPPKDPTGSQKGNQQQNASCREAILAPINLAHGARSTGMMRRKPHRRGRSEGCHFNKSRWEVRVGHWRMQAHPWHCSHKPGADTQIRIPAILTLEGHPTD
jgi:hypothetical protein